MPHAQGAMPGAAGDQDPTSARERDVDERGLAIVRFEMAGETQPEQPRHVSDANF